MKGQKKDIKQIAKDKFGINLTLNEDLNKFSGPEFEPQKFKMVDEKFAKQVVAK